VNSGRPEGNFRAMFANWEAGKIFRRHNLSAFNGMRPQLDFCILVAPLLPPPSRNLHTADLIRLERN
jgi:hypothetical protein